MFVGELPDGFRPVNAASQPSSYLGSPICCWGGHRLTTAIRRAQRFNARQLADGLPGRYWAFVVVRPRLQADLPMVVIGGDV